MTEAAPRPPLDRGLAWLRVALIADIVVLVTRIVAYQAVARMSSELMSVLERPLEGLALAVDLGFVIAWFTLVRATPQARSSLPRIALGLCAFDFCFALAFTLTPYQHLLGSASFVMQLAFLASAPVAWYALVRLGPDGRSVASARATTLMMALTGVRVMLWCVRTLTIRSLLGGGSSSVSLMFGVLNLLSVAASIAIAAQLLWLIARLRAAPLAVGANEVPAVLAASADDDILYGSLWLGGGLFVTIGSFMMASTGSGGGRYLITTGAIAYGVGRLVRGLGRR